MKKLTLHWNEGEQWTHVNKYNKSKNSIYNVQYLKHNDLLIVICLRIRVKSNEPMFKRWMTWM
jgi:hypothetical protein